jgi:arylsulfatase A-like enzyme
VTGPVGPGVALQPSAAPGGAGGAPQPAGRRETVRAAGSAGRLAAVLLLPAVVLASCAGREGRGEPRGPIRLLDGVEGAVAEWSPSSLPLPSELEPAYIGSAPPPGRVARIVMHEGEDGRDARVVLLAPSGPAGSRYGFPVAIPDGDPVLQVGLGYVLPAASSGAKVRFSIEVVPRGGGAVSLLDEEVAVVSDGHFEDREVPLAAWAGQEVTLELKTAPAGDRAPVWAAWASPEILDRRRPEAGWNVVLVVLDTLRPDHLGCYGYPRPTSPNLDALAERSIRFSTVVSQSSWTRPAHRALFSSLYPISKGGLSSPPLAEVLWRAGYRTEAITGGAQLGYQYGFSTGFDLHQIERWPGSVDMVVRKLAADRARKHFVFLHTYEIHDPYEHRELAAGLDPGRVGEVFSRATLAALDRKPTAGEKDYVRALYDSGIRYTDEQLGLLLGRLEEQGLLDDTLLVVTSDHGEELWDRGGWGHGHAMFDNQSRVPLFVHLPEAMRRARGLHLGPGSVVDQQVRLIDLYPTILDLVGVPFHHRIQGRSLLPLLAGRSLPEVDAFSESIYWGPTEVKALRSERYKYLLAMPRKPTDGGGESWEALYDLVADPEERVDVLGAQPQVAATMRAIVARIIAGGGKAEGTGLPPNADPELRRQLEALGYLGN